MLSLLSFSIVSIIAINVAFGPCYAASCFGSGCFYSLPLGLGFPAGAFFLIVSLSLLAI